jgi:hypothetical protein
MGDLHGEWRINLHISPTTWSFCSIIFAIIFIHLINFKTQICYSVWCAGWSDTANGCSKSRVHAVTDWYGSTNWQFSSSAAWKPACQG